jgi:hypothetical protein
MRVTEFIDFINSEKIEKRKYNYITITPNLEQLRYEYQKKNNLLSRKPSEAVHSIMNRETDI